MTGLLRLADLAVRLGFSLTLGTATGEKETVRAEDMRILSVVTNGPSLVATWKGHPLAGDDFTATARLKQSDGAWTWSFSYSGQTATQDVETVSFPEVTCAQADETRFLYPPALGPGRIFRPDWEKAKPGERVQESRLGVPSFQFTSVFTPGEGAFYLDARDTDCCARQFVYEKGTAPGTMRVCLRTPVPLTREATRAWPVPFGGTMRRFRGGWYEAASVYRPWAQKQERYRKAKARRNPSLENLGFWFWNRGAADKVAAVVERFQRLSGVPVALDWYWWHDIPYDMCYPNYWPPRDGEARFAATCRRLAEKGILTQVYMNGQSWDMDDPSWKDENGLDEMKLNRDGTWRAIAFNTYSGHRLTYVCGESPRFQGKIRAIAKKLRAAGLQSLYLDEISCTAHGVCYHPKHAHVPGDPHAMVRDYRRYVESVRRDNPGLLLSSEEFSEAYMDLFDSLITLFGCYERFTGSGAPAVEEVPVVPALYHGAFAMFGAYTMADGIPPWDPKWPPEGKWDHEEFWPAKFPDQFAVELTRSVVWGMQPTVHHFRLPLYDDPRHAANVKLMVDTARFYHAHRDYLYFGEMLSPGTLACRRQPVDFMCRKTYAKKGQYDVVRQPALPTVMRSVWRAEDGRVAAVLFNWSREPQDYDLRTPDVASRGVLPPRTWLLIERGKEREGR